MMSGLAESAIKLNLQPTNPGHFFACCGLLELSDRLWGGAEAWFDQGFHFYLQPLRPTANRSSLTLLDAIRDCELTNNMTGSQRTRREELSRMPRKVRDADPALVAEKKRLDAIYREAPVTLGEPFGITLNWFLDENAGGKELKTWAGQQSVVDIAGDMQRLVERGTPPQNWLFQSARGDSVPFNFDSAVAKLNYWDSARPYSK